MNDNKKETKEQKPNFMTLHMTHKGQQKTLTVGIRHATAACLAASLVLSGSVYTFGAYHKTKNALQASEEQLQASERENRKLEQKAEVLQSEKTAYADSIEEIQTKTTELEQKMKKAEFGFDDYLESMNQMKKMGGLSSLLSMMPGIGSSQIAEIENAMDEKKMARIEGIIYSMTPQERSNPDIFNMSRKRRVAKGAGVDIAEGNRLVKQFEQTRKMMKQMSGLMGGKGKRGKMGRFKLPF